MAKRRSGSSEPDPTEEPSESAASETAQEHGKAACGCVQQCWDELFSQYRDALGGIDREQVIYDSGLGGLLRHRSEVIVHLRIGQPDVAKLGSGAHAPPGGVPD